VNFTTSKSLWQPNNVSKSASRNSGAIAGGEGSCTYWLAKPRTHNSNPEESSLSVGMSAFENVSGTSDRNWVELNRSCDPTSSVINRCASVPLIG